MTQENADAAQICRDNVRESGKRQMATRKVLVWYSKQRTEHWGKSRSEWNRLYSGKGHREDTAQDLSHLCLYW